MQFYAVLNGCLWHVSQEGLASLLALLAFSAASFMHANRRLQG